MGKSVPHKFWTIARKFLGKPCPCEVESGTLLIATAGKLIQGTLLACSQSPHYDFQNTAFYMNEADIFFEGIAFLLHITLMFSTFFLHRYTLTFPWLVGMFIHYVYLLGKTLSGPNPWRLFDLFFRLGVTPYWYIVVCSFTYERYCDHRFRMSTDKEISLPPLIVSNRVGQRYIQQTRILENMSPHARARAAFRNISIPNLNPNPQPKPQVSERDNQFRYSNYKDWPRRPHRKYE